MLNKAFFDFVRINLFSGKLTNAQMQGMQHIENAATEYGISDLRQIAYILATPYHETAKTMQPIKEYGGFDYFMNRYDVSGKNPQLAKDLGNTVVGDGANYCGRGYCMITGRANYAKFSKILSVDLVGHPDYALNAETAAKILIYGMAQGLFTGKKLSDYINDKTCNYLSARRIINGMDKAELIAGYAKKFELALEVH